ncbi:ABC transporter ATP-binding protein [Bacillus marinisedimentorum]|uniref:ABC transporter ATP-binding protein n=1 Tax=Bacillus marinisedimentorum TaxID=1821260 RepID=UPI00087256CA|nr:ABC transporter ATP-binding protein [Bacillus marinisedimentorum]
MSAPFLHVENLTKQFGGVLAVNNTSFKVEQGEIFAVIGPNGAGKTTLLNMISGVLPSTSGSIRFQGKNITGQPPYRIARAGITRTFQNLEIFKNMSVIENVMTGAHIRLKTGLLGAGFRLPGVFREERKTAELALKCLEQVGIAHLAYEKAETLPYGNQRLLEIARASASDPAMILLDEPMAGLNAQETERLVDVILLMKQKGMTFMFVEHDIETVMAISDRILVLDNGIQIGSGTPEEIYQNAAVIKAYLGDEREEIVHA